MFNAISLSSLASISLEGNLLEEFEKEASKLKIYTLVYISVSNRKTARYHLPWFYQRLLGQPEVLDYLESFVINLEDVNHKDFTISKIYNSWPTCKESLKPISLRHYFGEESHKHDLSFLKETPSVEGFRAAEDVLLDAIVDRDKMSDGYYFPVPFEEDGELQGILYLIYDKARLNTEETEHLETFKRRLTDKYS